jgi:hypothetical protein
MRSVVASRETVGEVLPETHSLARSSGETLFTVLAAISACHLLNDLIQATIPALYPLFQRIFGLSPRRCFSRLWAWRRIASRCRIRSRWG